MSNPTWRAVAAPRRLALAAALAALALQVALLWLEWRPRPRPLWGDEGTYWRAAEEVRAGREPELHLVWPPLYPRFLAALAPLTGGTRLAVQLGQVALLAVAALCLWGLGREWLGERAAAGVAVALLVLDPQVASFTAFLWPELLHLAAFLFAWWALVAHGDRWPWLAAAGAALGIALLAKSLLVAFVPVLLAPLLLVGGWRRRLGRPAVVLAALVLVVLPTLIAHRQRYGVATLADSSLFNAWVGLNDRARRNFVDEIVGPELDAYVRSSPDPRRRKELVAERIGALVDERGVPAILAAQLGRQYFRLFDHGSFFSDQLPGGGIAAVPGYGYVAPPPWLAAALRAWGAVIYAVVLVAAAMGVAWSVASARGTRLAGRVARRPWLVVAALFVAYNLALFLVLHVKARYRVQFLPLLDLAAAVALVRAWRGQAPRTTGPWIAGGLVAALLLFLAFGGRWLA
jgi:hypothetical protein